MKTESSSLVTVTFSARDLVKATTDFISDVAPDCLLEGESAMVLSATSFLFAVINRDEARIREAFANGEALPSFCGIDPDAVFPEGSTPRVVIEWAEIVNRNPPVPVVVRPALVLELVGDSALAW